MYKITYNLDYSALTDFLEVTKARLKARDSSNLIEAVQTAGKYVVGLWITNAGAKFKHSQGDYVQGITDGVKYPFNSDPLHLVIENKAKHAYYLEHGVKPFDLKKMLETSTKVRVAKDGSRYLIIPFRHGSPGSVGLRAMPEHIYDEAKGLRHSVITNTVKEGVQQRGTKLEKYIPPVKGVKYYSDAQSMKVNNPQKVKRNTYVWGERLTDTNDNRYEGMVRFQKNVNLVRETIVQNTPIGKFTINKMVNRTDNNTTYSHYYNFRVMSETSNGWQHPGIDAMNLAKNTQEEAEQPVQQMIAEALEKDLVEMGFNSIY
jgi:hypothetical protein